MLAMTDRFENWNKSSDCNNIPCHTPTLPHGSSELTNLSWEGTSNMLKKTWGRMRGPMCIFMMNFTAFFCCHLVYAGSK
jgi:hypothetical protein